ncbi:MAG: hypothetical protein GF353_22885 [Candidatus Lokiarchaeota archaeon]|nr:hypothetical protein [Candidatus Lokiarchaeota archaeon]
MSIEITPSLLSKLMKRIYRLLRTKNIELREIWCEPSELIRCINTTKEGVSEVVNNFTFIKKKRGNYKDYYVIDKILFIAEAIRFMNNDFRNLAQILDYNGFEELVEEILLRHNYEAITNFRFSDKSYFRKKTSQSRYEVDVIGLKNNLLLMIDAKQWKRRDPFSIINRVADLQYQRAIALKKNPDIFSELITKLAQPDKTLKKKLPISIIPCIVTLEDSGCRRNDNKIPLIPISKFNSFLGELSDFVDKYKIIKINRITLQKKLI